MRAVKDIVGTKNGEFKLLTVFRVVLNVLSILGTGNFPKFLKKHKIM